MACWKHTVGWARQDQRLIAVEVSQAQCVLSGWLMMDYEGGFSILETAKDAQNPGVNM